MTNLVIEKWQQKEIKAGRAKVLQCTNCGKETYLGQMPLLSLSIRNHKPACSYECNKTLGQTE